MPLMPMTSVIEWARRVAADEPPHQDDDLVQSLILTPNRNDNADILDHISSLVPNFYWSRESDEYSFTCSTSNKCRSEDQTHLFNENHEYMNVVCMYCGDERNVPVYCGNRFCEVCSGPRRSRVRDRINWLIKHRKKHKDTMLKHLTLTIKNDADLPTMVKHLIASFRRLRQRKAFKAMIIGGAFVIELTNEDKGWHAHIHAIVQAYRLEWADLRDMWVSASKGSTGVFIQNIPPVEAVRYLTKYVSQCSLNIDNQKIATEALKHYRLFNPFGEWYAINKEYVRPPVVCSVCKKDGGFLVGQQLDIICDKFRNSS